MDHLKVKMAKHSLVKFSCSEKCVYQLFLEFADKNLLLQKLSQSINVLFTREIQGNMFHLRCWYGCCSCRTSSRSACAPDFGALLQCARSVEIWKRAESGIGHHSCSRQAGNRPLYSCLLPLSSSRKLVLLFY